MSDILETLYGALKDSSELTALLAEGAQGIHNDLTRDSGNYPVLVYQVISDVPHFWADNQETARRTTVQISILTKDGNDLVIISLVESIMDQLGWMRQITNRITSGAVRITALRYIYAEEE